MSQIKSSPAVTFMIQYKLPNARYVGYTNRKDAVKPENNLDKEEFTTMFTASENNAPKQRLKEIKDKLHQARDNGSIMWQAVVSFDNKFLAQQGLYDPKTQQVDQQAIKEIIRQAMPNLIKREQLSDDAFWWGNIHLNTKHVHAHLGISEIHSNRVKKYFAPRDSTEPTGNFSQKTIKSFKSQIYHQLLNDRDKQRLLDQEQQVAMLRGNLLDQLQFDPLKLDEQALFWLQQTYYHLPPKGKWRYNSNRRDFKAAKWYLDKYIDSYLKGPGKADYAKFIAETQSYLMEYEHSYTSQKPERNNHYQPKDWNNLLKETSKRTAGGSLHLQQEFNRRIEELHQRLGGRVLRHLRENPLDKLSNNLTTFSQVNQKKILDAVPTATVVHNQLEWQRLGYRIGSNTTPIILKSKEKGQTFSNRYWDISQVQLNAKRMQKPRVKLHQALWLTPTELAEIVERLKEKDLLSPLEKQELGIYRSAIRKKNLMIEQEKVVVRLKELTGYDALPNDRQLISIKRTQTMANLQMLELQLKPKWQRTEKESKKLTQLKQQIIDPIKVPIDQVDIDFRKLRLKALQEEKQAVTQSTSKEVLAIANGSLITKNDYLKRLDRMSEIISTKGRIYDRNKLMSEQSESKTLKRQNGQDFKKLKELYNQLESNLLWAQQNDKVQTEKTTRLQQTLVIHKTFVRQSKHYHQQFKSVVPPTRQALKATNLMLKANGRSEMKALQAKWRTEREGHEDEREFERGLER